MAVFDNFPYTNIHELNLDWLIKSTGEVSHLAGETKEIAAEAETLLQETNELVTNLDARIDSLVDEAVTEYLDTSTTVQDAISDVITEGVEHVHVMDPDNYCIYVAATSGTDDNDGRDASRPVKTLDKAFEIMNHHQAGAWIYLQESGNYYITKRYINACTFHLTARAPGVTIYWGTDPTSTALLAMYNVYIHLEGYGDGSTVFHINGTNATGSYLEVGKMYASYITFESEAPNGKIWSTTGASGTYTHCIFKTKVTVASGKVNFNACTFEPAVNNGSSCAVGCSQLSTINFSESATFNNISSANCEQLVKTDRCYVIFTGRPTLNNVDADCYTVYAERTTFTGNAAVCQAWLGTNTNSELHYNNVVNGKWYPNICVSNGGYDSQMLVETAAKNTLYNFDPNAKGLSFRFRLYSGTTNIASWADYYDCSLFRDDVTTMEYNSASMWVRNANIASNVPTCVWIRYQIKSDTQNGTRGIQYTNSYAVTLNNTSSINAGTYEVRVEIRQVF